MGCDIHGHIEFKHKGQWHHYTAVRMERIYDVFNKLAGVRGEPNDGKIMSFNRGFPVDANFTTRFDYEVRWGSDAHTPGWIADGELTEFYTWLKSVGIVGKYGDERPGAFGYFFGNYVDSHILYPQDQAYLEIESVRFVFWFDN